MIYDINDQYLWAGPDGEDFQPDALEDITVERDQWIERAGMLCKNLDAEADAIMKEIKNLQERLDHKLRKRESVAGYLQAALEGQRFETAKVAINFRRSKSVYIRHEDQIPVEFIVEKVSKRVDKTAIRDALKAGADVPGAEMVEHLNMRIQ